jgi:hypothetical protein
LDDSLFGVSVGLVEVVGVVVLAVLWRGRGGTSSHLLLE